MRFFQRSAFVSVVGTCLVVAFAGGLAAPSLSDDSPLLYMDPSQTVETRVRDLLARMTLEEKVAQMTQVPLSALAVGTGTDGYVSQHALEDLFGGISPGTLESPFIDATRVSRISEAVDRYLREDTRLGVPALQIAEGLHGYLALETTIFPQAIAQGSTWNRDLIRAMSSAVAREASLAGVDQMLSPIFDVARDPRWGRVEETYGEDPYLVAEMGMAYVIGLQGEPETTRHGIPGGKLMATAKH
ncbi:MAG: beta-glucosidase, partial [Gemmatimonadetes bacterium]|nr:beta-glucosidase [Gemmatimonadota bacterium]